MVFTTLHFIYFKTIQTAVSSNYGGSRGICTKNKNNGKPSRIRLQMLDQ